MTDPQDFATPIAPPIERKNKHGRKSDIRRKYLGRSYDPSSLTRLRIPDDVQDPRVIERQVRAFEARVAGYNIDQIATLLNSNRKTITLDLQEETARRMGETLATRDEKIALQAARYEKVATKLNAHIEAIQADIEDARARNDHRTTIALRGIVAAERKSLVATFGCIDQIYGLRAPIKVEVEHKTPTFQVALDVINSLSVEQRQELRSRGVAAKEARMKNVTPSADVDPA